jgi:uncharacterized membrane protein
MVDGRPSFDDLFAGFKNYLSSLGRMLLLTLIILGLTVLAESLVFVGQFMKSTPIMIVGWLIYISFVIGVLLRLYFSFLLVVDKDMGAIDALGASWRMTQGKTLKLVGLAFLSTLVAMSGVIACGIGMIWTMTMAYIMYASAYRQIAGPSQQPAAMPAW